jgi:fructose-bisphosphate aldolase, class I
MARPMHDGAATASALVAPGKGILAADESIPTVSARLARARVAPTAENRRAYREMLVTAPGLAAGISGVILCDETLRQRLAGGRTFPEALAGQGMLAGVRADTGARPLPGAPGETVAEGLDGLPSRLREYAGLGAAFAKWRAVLAIGAGIPSPMAIRANAQAACRYAAACQQAGLVPVVETDVLMSGPHSLGQCETVTALVLLEVVTALQDCGVDFGSVVLRPSMALPGLDSAQSAAPAQVADATLAALGSVPAALAGVAFLSGGQAPGQATANLAALQQVPALWPLTFCFGRALAGPALAAWRGDPAAVPAGQSALLRRVALNAAALAGRYTPELELGRAGPL